MSSSIISKNNSEIYTYSNDEQSSCHSDWCGFVREHTKSRPAMPGSDFLVARSYSSDSSSVVDKDRDGDSRREFSDDGKEIIEINPSISERWAKVTRAYF